MRRRLQNHLRQRLTDRLTTLRSHWVLSFFALNLPRMASIIVWAGHTKRGAEISYVDAAGLSPLYEGGSRFLPDSEPRASGRTSRTQSRRWSVNTCGAYLYRDDLLQMWIRSGKVTRSGGYPARKREHNANANKPVTNKTVSFYRAFNDSIEGGTRGVFDTLKSFLHWVSNQKMSRMFAIYFVGLHPAVSYSRINAKAVSGPHLMRSSFIVCHICLS